MLSIKNNTEVSDSASADVVGRFRSGYQVNGEPAGLDAFRITTGDEKLAKAIAKAFGTDKDKPNAGGPAEWEAQGEDYLEVFTTTSAVNIILDSASAYQSSLSRRTADGDFMYATNGETITSVGEDYEDEYTVGDPDPQAEQDLETRKAKAKKGLGAKPDVRIRFTIEAHPEWGTFEFRSGGWSLVQNDPEPKLRRLPEGPILAQLKLTHVNGKKFSWTKPELLVRKSLADGAVTNEKPAAYGDDVPF